MQFHSTGDSASARSTDAPWCRAPPSDVPSAYSSFSTFSIVLPSSIYAAMTGSVPRVVCLPTDPSLRKYHGVIEAAGYEFEFYIQQDPKAQRAVLQCNPHLQVCGCWRVVREGDPFSFLSCNEHRTKDCRPALNQWWRVVAPPPPPPPCKCKVTSNRRLWEGDELTQTAQETFDSRRGLSSRFGPVFTHFGPPVLGDCHKAMVAGHEERILSSHIPP